MISFVPINNNNNYNIKKTSPKYDIRFVKFDKTQISKNKNTNNTSATALYYLPFIITTDLKLRNKAIETSEKSEPFNNDGYKGVVYKMRYNNNLYALKVGKTGNANFEQEANNLKKLPKDFTSSQQYVDYFRHGGKEYLISTFVPGKSGFLKCDEDFKKYIKILQKLDAHNIMHNDLNMKNCIFNKGEISVIDYGEAYEYKTWDCYSDGSPYPAFMLKNNLTKFEHNGITDCIEQWDKNNLDSWKLFKTYLKNKSEYFYDRTQKLENLGIDNKSLDYEKNLAQVLNNPSDEVVKNEARRVDILNAYEMANSAVTYRKNPNEIYDCWSVAKIKVQAARDNINHLLKQGKLSDDEKKYFNYQKEIYNCMHGRFIAWSYDTLKWVENALAFEEYMENDPNASAIIANRDIVTNNIPKDFYSMVIKNINKNYED